ncbi:hypothetical protein [Saccharicrinis fermentans]|uniref:Uncharacterized protein n=1 Tax=Saccharicrinis fermentans DSM 9555 = JCM 21142 TaxID=869213 RepID=W7YE65_9BACT|nr:hypothetical protein [Saccharicrinis fermentans]GAF05768.1 hypothetical protein JCM21142_104520 [Saccharicrinis fermentans DSM 9555 = JCM 21142]
MIVQLPNRKGSLHHLRHIHLEVTMLDGVSCGLNLKVVLDQNEVFLEMTILWYKTLEIHGL